MGEVISYSVVDDEPAAHIVFSKIMNRHKDFILNGSYYSADSALQGLMKSRPDLVFLDFRMPGMSGIELLKRMTIPLVSVMTTAHSGHALDAYDLGVRDYLLKPVSQERLDVCLERLRPILSGSGKAAKYLAFPIGHAFRMTHPSDILAVEASGNFSTLITVNEKILVSENLKSVDRRLAPFGFCRIHKSFIINIAKLKETSNTNIKLSDGSTYPVGSVYKRNFFERIEVF